MQKYKNLISLANKNRFSYKKIIPDLVDFNSVRNFWQKVIVYI